MDLENFPTREMARDMMSMISPIYDRSYVGKWIFEVMSVALELARQTVDDLQNEAFPNTATWSLPLWEEAYGIPTNESLSIEERRKALVKKRNFRRPMNPYRIAQLVTEICGRPVELIENVAPHTFEIRIGPGTSEAEIQAIIDTVKEVKQSQKSFRVVFDTAVGVKIHAETYRSAFGYRMTGTSKKAGRWPRPNVIGKVIRSKIIIGPEEKQTAFPYVMSGTKPDINIQGKITRGHVNVQPGERKTNFPYVIAGTEPDVNMQGKISVPGLNARISGEKTGIVYKICGAKRL